MDFLFEMILLYVIWYGHNYICKDLHTFMYFLVLTYTMDFINEKKDLFVPAVREVVTPFM